MDTNLNDLAHQIFEELSVDELVLVVGGEDHVGAIAGPIRDITVPQT